MMAWTGGGGEKWAVSRSVLNVEFTGFTNDWAGKMTEDSSVRP